MAYFNFKEILEHQKPVDPANVSGNISDYTLADITQDTYQDHLLTLAKGLLSENECLGIPSVRELYEICISNDPKTSLNDLIKIEDIYCGRSTLSKYQTRFTGCKLIEARYYDCEEENQLIFFKYPYTEKRQFSCTMNVKIFVNNPTVYNNILRRTYKYENPVLLYTRWRPVGMELFGTIDDLKHIDII